MAVIDDGCLDDGGVCCVEAVDGTVVVAETKMNVVIIAVCSR